jgi:hypothetical protein
MPVFDNREREDRHGRHFIIQAPRIEISTI